MAITSLKFDECVCGRFYAAFQPESYHLADLFGSASAGILDVFTCGEQAICSACGREIDLPPAEMLDIERSPFLSWVDGWLSELDF